MAAAETIDRRWTEPEDAVVDSLLGTNDMEEVAATLSERVGIMRAERQVAIETRDRIGKPMQRKKSGAAIPERHEIIGAGRKRLLIARQGLLVLAEVLECVAPADQRLERARIDRERPLTGR